MDLGVKGKAYIIVGGSKGMGWEAARVLAADGANLAIISRDGALCKDRAAELKNQFKIEARGYAADAMKEGAVETVVAQAIKDFGKIRGLLTTPGTTQHNGTLLDMTEEDWTHTFNDTFMSQVRSCRAILPHLLENGGGNLVTTGAFSSRAAKDFLFGYAALKAGLNNFTKNVAKTYGARGIRANCVCPGAVETDGLKKLRKEAAVKYGKPEAEALEHVMFTEWKMPVATKRVGKPEELGEMMAFLLSERAAYTTGAIINVDGGTDF